MRVFHEDRLSSLLESQITRMKSVVESEDRNYILNANETQLILHFRSKYQIEPLAINVDQKYVSDREEMIKPTRGAGFGFLPVNDEPVRRQVITYHVPFSGDEKLFRYAPSNRLV